MTGRKEGRLTTGPSIASGAIPVPVALHPRGGALAETSDKKQPVFPPSVNCMVDATQFVLLSATIALRPLPSAYRVEELGVPSNFYPIEAPARLGIMHDDKEPQCLHGITTHQQSSAQVFSRA